MPKTRLNAEQPCNEERPGADLARLRGSPPSCGGVKGRLGLVTGVRVVGCGVLR